YDKFIYKRIRTEKAQFPVHALMTHGIIDGTYNRLGGEDEDTLEWSDGAMFYLGRGVMMCELYLTPSLVTPERWALLGAMLRWAGTRDAAFVHGVLEGGDPSKGEAYWYHHDDGSSEIIALRNPSFTKQLARIKLHRAGALVRSLYPFQEWMPGKFAGSDGVMKLGLHNAETAVFETVPRAKLKRPAVIGARSVIIRQTLTETEYEITSATPRVGLKIVWGGKVNEVNLDGKKLARGGDGSYAGAISGGSARGGEDVKAKISNDAGGVTIDARWTVPADATDSKFVVIARTVDPVAPDNVLINGERVRATVIGAGWSAFVLPAPAGSDSRKVVFDRASLAGTPFLESKKIKIDVAWLGEIKLFSGRLVVKHAKAGPDTAPLPPTPMQDSMAYIHAAAEQREFDVSAALSGRAFVPGDVKAAKLLIRVAGHTADGPPRVAQLNGAPVAMLVNTDFPHEDWENFIVDIPEINLRSVKAKNRLVIMNTVGGPFKFKEIMLAARMSDGAWISTPAAGGVQTAGKDWALKEGDNFETTSKPVKLIFPDERK
ncbi:MAG TPA: hypothetical protein PLQ76_09295, partial [bacterium]|nr:hypothetical protein [bacterium]